RFDVRDRRKNFVVDVNQLRTVGRLASLAGDHDGNRLPLVADLLGRDRVARRIGQLVRREDGCNGKRGRPGDDVLEVRGGIYSDYTGSLLRSVNANTANQSVGVRAPYDHHMD